MANNGPVRFDQINRITQTRYRLLDTLNTTPVDLLTGEQATPVGGSRFVTECEAHGVVVGWRNLHQSRMAMAMPNWCRACKRVLTREGVYEVAPVEEEEEAATA